MAKSYQLLDLIMLEYQRRCLTAFFLPTFTVVVYELVIRYWIIQKVVVVVVTCERGANLVTIVLVVVVQCTIVAVVIPRIVVVVLRHRPMYVTACPLTRYSVRVYVISFIHTACAASPLL